MSAKNHDDDLVTIAIVDRATMAEVSEMTEAPEFKIPAACAMTSVISSIKNVLPKAAFSEGRK